MLNLHACAFVSPPIDVENVKAPGVTLINKAYHMSHSGDFPSILTVVGDDDALCTLEKLHKLRERAAVNTQIVPGADHAWSRPGTIEALTEKIHQYVHGGTVTKVPEEKAGMIYLPFQKTQEYVLAPKTNVGSKADCKVVDLDHGTEGRVTVDDEVVGVLHCRDRVTVLGVQRVGPNNSKRRERVRIESSKLDKRGWVCAEALSGDWAIRSYYIEPWPGADSDGETDD